eukprot:COSAG01_NODE_28116_length_668_cov_4.908612_2_plen_96_part_01
MWPNKLIDAARPAALGPRRPNLPRSPSAERRAGSRLVTSIIRRWENPPSPCRRAVRAGRKRLIDPPDTLHLFTSTIPYHEVAQQESAMPVAVSIQP